MCLSLKTSNVLKGSPNFDGIPLLYEDKSVMAAHVKEKDILFIPYLEDFMIAAAWEQKCRGQVAMILSSLGWQLHFEKSR